MKELESVKILYKPMQPAVGIDHGQIRYEEINPCKEIECFVYSYWQLKTRKGLSETFSYRVVSDGCIDVFFEINDPGNSYLMGFCRKYSEFQIGKRFNYFGIRFLPSAFPLLFGVNAKDLSNRSQDLKEILPEFASWLSKLSFSEYDITDLVMRLDDKIRKDIGEADLNGDARFYNSLIEILKRNGFVDIEKELNVGLSARQLRRIYNYYIGTTPKAFSNVVRFQHILNAKPSMQSLRENKMYYDVGFFDQAHFIKSFKSFYGVTPTQAFR